MRLIDADEFAEYLKDAVKRQKYEDTTIDRLLTVADVIEAVISELDGTSLVGFKNAPTIELRCEECEAFNKTRLLIPQPEIIRCKDCKHFHYDMPYVIQGIPVLGHEVCDFWGDGCKTSENGFCNYAERRTDE